MTTRLDRLILLLETGTTPVVRKAAADQLGEVQKLHPHELDNLLTKVHVYLRGNSWDSRIAASQAVEAITRNVPQWQPRGAPKSESSDFLPAVGQLTFKQFNLDNVLQCGSALLSSEGIEYIRNTGRGDIHDQLKKQKQLLNKQLGVDVAGGLGVDTDDLYKDEDLVLKTEDFGNTASHIQKSVTQLISEQAGYQSSARERNREKRMAKLLAKQVSRESPCEIKSNGNCETEAPPGKKPRLSPDSCQDSSSDITDMTEMDEWPFEAFCELLLMDLFHSSWEYRHGAACGLRAIIKHHGHGASKNQDTPSNHLCKSNQLWLIDVSLRLVCVLALDRFGDFISDEVVAPVRETCAQTLGIILRFLEEENVVGVLHALLQLLVQPQWEVRHGGMLGLKYLLAVRQDLRNMLLPKVLPSVFSGLKDPDDDVRAVAAAALVPVVNDLVVLLPNEVDKIVSCLWVTLEDLDDLTSSTNSIMNLLSALLKSSRNQTVNSESESLTSLVPRLWPFLRHNIASVRKATLETLLTVLQQEEKSSVAFWLIPILQDALRHIFQCSLLENQHDILQVIPEVWRAIIKRCPSDYVVAAASPWMGAWLCLVMQPSKVAFDENLLIEAKHTIKEHHASKGRPVPVSCDESRNYIGGFDSLNASLNIRDQRVVCARIAASCLLGNLCPSFVVPIPNIPEGVETPLLAVAKLFNFHLCTKSAIQRLVIALVIQEWSSLHKNLSSILPDGLKSKFLDCLQESIYFDEIAMLFTRMQSDCRDFISSLRQQKVDIDAVFQAADSVLTMDQANSLCSKYYEDLRQKLKSRQQLYFDDRCTQLKSIISQTNTEQQVLSTRVLACLAGVSVTLGLMPEKLNPVIRPLMESIKKEDNSQLQIRAAFYLSRLLDLCLSRATNPCSKIIKNLCSALCCDRKFTPSVDLQENDADDLTNCDCFSGILTLSTQQQKILECKKGYYKKTSVSSETQTTSLTNGSEQENRTEIQRRGAAIALKTVAQYYSKDIFTKLPCFWQTMTEKLMCFSKIDSIKISDNKEAAQDLVDNLQVLEVVAQTINPSLCKELIELLKPLTACLSHPYTAARHMAARCIGTLSKVSIGDVLTFVLETLLPIIGGNDDDVSRQGAIESLHCVIDQLEFDILPYAVLLVVPLLGRMSDQNEHVRLMATQCFATVIRLLPLEAGIVDPPHMKESLIQQKEDERHFLEQLMDTSKLDDYKVPVTINADLRQYQQDGVNWLWFLNRYQLHGILCDDMGLGKTLMSICILAGDHHIRKEKYKETKSSDYEPLASIVVCPPTLAGHWLYEIENFVSKDCLNPLCYIGPPLERQRLQNTVASHNLIIASYDIVRNDIDFFKSKNWNYCILDEGHIIKKKKTTATLR